MENLAVAETLLLRMEKRFSNDPIFRDMYVAFLQDYEETGHMIKNTHFLLFLFLTPSWCVKKNALIAKLRTVFNGSAKGLNKISINDLMHTGATLLSDLAELLIH